MGKHDRTLAAVFTSPAPANVDWRDIEVLLRTKGAHITAGSGSRVRVMLNGVVATFHRPHPQHEAGRPTVRSVRDFLAAAGVVP